MKAAIQTMSRQAQVVSLGEPGGPPRASKRGASAVGVATAIADPSLDSCLSALSAAVAELVGDHGRRPTRASSWWLDDSCVVTALEGFLTPAERALVTQGEERAVRDLRSAFGEAIRDEYVRVAEGALSREVIDHRSEVICASAVCLEIFLLVDEQRIPSVRPLPVLAPEPNTLR